MSTRKKKSLTRNSSSSQARRLDVIDLLRGIAVLMMVSYHFCYDLAHFGFANWSTNDMLLDVRWITWRNGIVNSFLLIVGISLALRTAFKPSWPDFWKRWLQIAGAAALVSIGSVFFAGERWIYFGILHFVAAALLLGRCLLIVLPSALPLALLGLVTLVFGLLFSHPMFDAPPLNIIGLAIHKPQTEDYVPLLPWMGLVLIGMALGLYWKSRNFAPIRILESMRNGLPSSVQKTLIWMGSWALSIYLIHQPILMGLLSGIHALKQ